MNKSFSLLSLLIFSVFFANIVFAEISNELKAELMAKAEHGDAEAQDSLGYMYSEGISVNQDKAKAKLWWEKAAQQGDVQAQFNLGNMYGLNNDWPKAKFWWEKAAEQGDTGAKEMLEKLMSK